MLKTAFACSVFLGFTSYASAQSDLGTLAENLAKQGLRQAEDIVEAAPLILETIEAELERGVSFESAEVCLMNLQSIVAAGNIVSNSLPFSQVWTLEDSRGPVGRLRLILNGKKISYDIFCEESDLITEELDWESGRNLAVQEVTNTSISSALGITLNLRLQEAMANVEDKASDEFPETENPCGSNSVATRAAIGGPFELVSDAGKTVTEKDVIDQPVLVYFGYTFCPDVCPMDLARNAEVVDILDSRGIDVKPVLITVDPERDTPEVLAEYVGYLHEKMVGLTGSLQQIESANQAYRTYYNKQQHAGSDSEYYLVDHSTFTYLVTPEDGFLEYFRRDASPDEMADSVACYLTK